MVIFIVQHLHTLPDGTEDSKLIGAYDSKTTATAAVNRLRSQPGFSNSPKIIDSRESNDAIDGFYIDEYEVNKDHWPDGFMTV